MTIVFLAIGLALLTFGAELLVRGSAALALAARVSPLVVGLTIVAYGTSAPELVISVQSALAGEPEIALGNVIGSNIFNVLFILGISALIVPLVVSQQLVRFDVPLMIVVSILFMVLCLDGNFGRIDGAIFVASAFTYTIWAIVQSRREQTAIAAEYEQEFGSQRPQRTVKAVLWNIFLVAVGLGLLVLGARMFIEAAVEIARAIGVSELVIGLTIVAAGTSLPEVATSIVAAIKGERDIAVGNVVGSNLFNLLTVMGTAGLVSPNGVAVPTDALYVDLPVMVAVAVACLPIFLTGHLIARWEGALFFAYYCAYTAWLVLAATDASILPAFRTAMLGFVLPLTAVTLTVLAGRSWLQTRL